MIGPIFSCRAHLAIQIHVSVADNAFIQILFYARSWRLLPLPSVSGVITETPALLLSHACASCGIARILMNASK
jgi:hypothetical protein